MSCCLFLSLTQQTWAFTSHNTAYYCTGCHICGIYLTAFVCEMEGTRYIRLLRRSDRSVRKNMNKPQLLDTLRLFIHSSLSYKSCKCTHHLVVHSTLYALLSLQHATLCYLKSTDFLSVHSELKCIRPQPKRRDFFKVLIHLVFATFPLFIFQFPV